MRIMEAALLSLPVASAFPSVGFAQVQIVIPGTRKRSGVTLTGSTTPSRSQP